MKQWLTSQEAAEIIGVSRVTIHRWRQAGNVFLPGTVRPAGVLRTTYLIHVDEVERLRKLYAKNEDGLAVAA